MVSSDTLREWADAEKNPELASITRRLADYMDEDIS